MTQTPETLTSTLTVRQGVESILMTTEKPVSIPRLIEALGVAGIEAEAADIEAAIGEVNEGLAAGDFSVRVERLAGGFRLMTLPVVAEALAAFHGDRVSPRLSRAALETLSIIAYRQPVTRAELESIRGVASGEVLRSLLERRLITVAGRAEELGRPMLYGTTPEFLKQFGLAKVGDLPPIEGVGA